MDRSKSDKDTLERSSTFTSVLKFAHISHPAILILSCCAIAVDTFFWLLEDSKNGQMDLVFLVYCILILLLEIRPSSLSVVLICYSMLCNLLPSIDSGHMLVGIWLAFATMFLECRIWLALSISAINIVTVLLSPSFFNGRQLQSGFVMLLFQMAFSIAGYALCHHRKELEEKESHRQLVDSNERISRLERDMAMASRLHDKLTNDLSYVTITAHAALIESSNKEEKTRWKGIIESVDDAFRCTYEVIAMLDQNRPLSVNNSQPLDAVRIGETIRRIIDRNTKKLEQTGFIGHCTMNFSRYSIGMFTGERIQEAEGLLTELFNNIQRHCVPYEDTYVLHVEFSQQGLEVTQMNTIALQLQNPCPKTSGHGINMIWTGFCS